MTRYFELSSTNFKWDTMVTIESLNRHRIHTIWCLCSWYDLFGFPACVIGDFRRILSCLLVFSSSIRYDGLAQGHIYRRRSLHLFCSHRGSGTPICSNLELYMATNTGQECLKIQNWVIYLIKLWLGQLTSAPVQIWFCFTSFCFKSFPWLINCVPCLEVNYCAFVPRVSYMDSYSISPKSMSTTIITHAKKY